MAGLNTGRGKGDNVGLEKEVKFAWSDFDQLRLRLRQQRAHFVHQIFERNQVFDTPERDLKAQGKLLRLRRTDRAVLCLKTPPQGPTSEWVKVWEEAETEVQDPDTMQDILKGLGYQVAFSYEKFREKWRLDSCVICLDRVPFGRFVEIEGEPDPIWARAADLGLGGAPWTTKSYHELHRQWRERNHLPRDESFVFSQEDKEELAHWS